MMFLLEKGKKKKKNGVMETRLPETVILEWYSVEKWRLCYNSLLFPVNGMELWETHIDVVVMPPPDRIMPGRPKNNDRIKDPNEKTYSQNSQKAIVSCSNCGQTGHNKRTCQIEPVPKPPNPPSEFPSYHAKVIVKCSNCQQTGHNKRKCHLEPVSKPTCYFFCCIMFAFNVSLDFVVLF